MSYIDTLFNTGELVCLGRTIYDTGVMTLGEAKKVSEYYEFICINPLKTNRCDANCSAYRNILVEFDTVPVEDQLAIVQGAGMPYTSHVFSGKKSHHFIISLTEPFATEEEYRHITRWIYKVFPRLVDTNCINPSRFSRLPGTIRGDTGLEQTLIEIKARVTLAKLMEWLSQSKAPEPPIFTYPSRPFMPLKNRLAVTKRTNQFLVNGASPGTRTSELFIATCNLYESGYTEAEIIHKVKSVIASDNNPPWHESKWLGTISGAVERINSRQNLV